MANHGNAKQGAVPAGLLNLPSRVLGVLEDVHDLDWPLLDERPADHRAAVLAVWENAYQVAIGLCHLPVEGDDPVVAALFVVAQDVAEIGASQLDSVAVDRLQHLVEVESGAGDRIEDLAQRGQYFLAIVALWTRFPSYRLAHHDRSFAHRAR